MIGGIKVNYDRCYRYGQTNNGYAGKVTSVADSGTPQLDNFSSSTGTVAGHSGQGAIELRDIGFSANTSTSYQANTVKCRWHACEGVHTADLALLGNYLAVAFVTSKDGHGRDRRAGDDKPIDRCVT